MKSAKWGTGSNFSVFTKFVPVPYFARLEWRDDFDGEADWQSAVGVLDVSGRWITNPPQAASLHYMG